MKETAKALYKELNIETPKGQILQPSPGIYRSIFAWDSGWHYYWLKEIDPDRAIEEMVTLYSYQEKKGRIPHEIPLGSDLQYPLSRRIQLYLLRNSFNSEGTSWYVDPPVYIAAALDCVQESEKISPLNGGQRNKIEFLRNGAFDAFQWIRENRCPEFLKFPYSHLPVIMHPLESGTDLAPSFDSVWGRLPILMMKVVTLLKKINPTGWTLKGKGEPGFPIVFDLTFLTFYLLSAKKLLGSTPEINELLDAFWIEFYDNEMSLFRQKHFYKGKLMVAENITLSSVLPCLLYHDTGYRDQARSIIEKHSLLGKTFWKGRIPSFNTPERSTKSFFLWRGSCSWMNMNYSLFNLFLMYGFKSEGALLFKRLEEYLKKAGPMEYFDAFELEGGGARPFSWNGLMAPMEAALAGNG